MNEAYFTTLKFCTMLVPDELKLNRFRLVAIPSNADYFRRLGLASAPENFYTGDEPDYSGESKLEQIARINDDDLYHQYLESKQSTHAEEPAE